MFLFHFFFFFFGNLCKCFTRNCRLKSIICSQTIQIYSMKISSKKKAGIVKNDAYQSLHRCRSSNNLYRWTWTVARPGYCSSGFVASKLVFSWVVLPMLIKSVDSWRRWERAKTTESAGRLFQLPIAPELNALALTFKRARFSITDCPLLFRRLKTERISPCSILVSISLIILWTSITPALWSESIPSRFWSFRVGMVVKRFYLDNYFR